MNQSVSSTTNRTSTPIMRIGLILVVFAAIVFAGFKFFSGRSGNEAAAPPVLLEEVQKVDSTDSLMAQLYDEKIAHIVNGDTSGRWPVKTEYPLRGSILPYKRIVSFYGNLYSKQMGILGELPPTQMLAKLKQEVSNWQKADSALEVIPALHYIAVTAQQSPGKGSKYRLRMPFHQIDSVINMAARINAIVFVDVQVGLSTLQQEIPELEKYLKMPQMHLGIDPEFSMKGGQAPGKVIGTFDAADINYVTEYLAKLVRENNLPPKVLVIHRFTKGMVTNYKQIKIRPEVQIVMDMDGWGGPTLKYSSYQQYIYREPVQYAGFKLFYKNDIKNNNRLMTPKEVLALKPQPVYIQYQ
jgi:hypothetical protein